MATRERAVHRGRDRGRELSRQIGKEIRLARRRLGLTHKVVGRQAGISASELSRIERGLADWASLVLLTQLCAVVGLDLSARAYPGGPSLRDARHGRLLATLHGLIHPSLGWGAEVPLPNAGDQRAWDAMVRGDGWRYGIEAELNPIDGQALMRRLTLKQRDGGVDGVILLLPDTRQTRQFRREFRELLAADFPTPGRLALERLSNGLDPGGSSIVIL